MYISKNSILIIQLQKNNSFKSSIISTHQQINMDAIHTKVTCTLKSPLQHAFSELWRKAYSPQDFIQGIEKLQLIQKKDDLIVRQMTLKGMKIKQKITKDKETGTVKFHNFDDSCVKGDIFNQVVPNPQGKQNQILLSFYSNAKNIKGENFPPEEVFQKALQRTKQVIQATIKN